jgi:hypothetical protein
MYGNYQTVQSVSDWLANFTSDSDLEKNVLICTPMATSPEASGDDGTQGFTIYA